MQNRFDNKRWDVLTIGDVFTDIVLTGFAHWPQPGEEVDAQQQQRDLGGGAAITACGLARLGMRTAVLACVGADDDEWMRARLQACGVDTSGLQTIVGQPTGLSVAVSTADDRAFFTQRGANEQLSEVLARREIQTLLTQARHVHLAFPPALSLLVELALISQDADATISLDVGWQPDWLTNRPLRRALRNLDLFLPNAREAELMTRKKKPEQMLQAFVEKHFPPTVVKLGAHGSATMRAGEYLAAAPFLVEPLDTTGAGDCFNAGFFYGWLNDLPLADCLRLGNFCGARSTLALGGIAGFPTLAEVQDVLFDS